MASKLQQQVTQTLAEAFNLLQQSDLPKLRPAQLKTVQDTIAAFQAVVQSFAEEKLLVEEPSNPEPEDFTNEVA